MSGKIEKLPKVVFTLLVTCLVVWELYSWFVIRPTSIATHTVQTDDDDDDDNDDDNDDDDDDDGAVSLIVMNTLLMIMMMMMMTVLMIMIMMMVRHSCGTNL